MWVGSIRAGVNTVVSPSGRAPRSRVIGALGHAARLARAAHLEQPARHLTHALDALFVLAPCPPLRADLRGLAFRGYLRHRSVLANDVRPETSYCELFEQSLRPGLTVVDGGAHLGAYAVLAARAVGPSGAVLAVEPDAYNFRALAYNVRRLADGRVRLSSKALAASSGRVPFHLSSGTRGSSLYERSDTIGVTEVETTTIDDELDDAPLEGGLLVKLNVEGAEPLVLEGMRRTLARVEDVTLFVEAHHVLLGRAGTTVEALVHQLRRAGFRVWWLDGAYSTLAPVERAPRDRNGHLYCVRGA